MRILVIGALSAALAAGVAGCSSPGSDAVREPPLVATGNERLVSLRLGNMT